MARDDAIRGRSSPLVMRRWLAAELVRLRTAAKLTQRDVAQRLGCSVARVSYLENGERAVNPIELEEVLLELYSVPREDREKYLAAARVAGQQGWWDHWADADVAYAERRYLGIEDGATRLRGYVPSIVHGLLQTPDYTGAILRSLVTLPEAKIARLVQMRQVRQSLLTRAEDPLEAHLIHDEAAVKRQVGSVEIMKAQLLHIAGLAESQANVTVQIVTFDAEAHGAYFGAFSILDFASSDDPGLVYVEGLVESRYFDRRANVYEHARLFERLAGVALTPAESIARLRAEAASAAS